MLIKAGTKRRRSQAEIQLDKDAEGMKEQIARENEERIKVLEQRI